MDMINEREKLSLSSISEIKREYDTMDPSVSVIPGKVSCILSHS